MVSRYVIILMMGMTLAICPMSLSSAEESSTATFGELDREIGCSSELSADKKRDLFDAKYLGRRFTWEGEITSADTLMVLVEIDGHSPGDLAAKFRGPIKPHELARGETIRLSFVLESPGDCYLPFRGDDAVMLR